MEFSPDVLRSAAADPASEAWNALWAQSCHQGTCDPASAVLLPWLSTTIATFASDVRVTPLALAGFIAVDATAADRVAYASSIAALRALAKRRMTDAADDREFVYLQQAVLGFDGDAVWGKELDHLNDGEVDVQCSDCDAEILVDLLDESSGIIPGLSSELAEQLHVEAIHAGRILIAAYLTRLFGRIECPDCGIVFDLAEHLGGVSVD